MGKGKLLIVFVAAIVLSGMIFGIFLFSGETKEGTSPEPTVIDRSFSGLGITYLPVTQGLSEYYGLGVEYGDLVTEVTPGSPADLAGLKAGDVILSFNGTRPEEPTSLLGMMMACPVGNTVTLEIWRQKQVETIQLSHQE